LSFRIPEGRNRPAPIRLIGKAFDLSKRDFFAVGNKAWAHSTSHNFFIDDGKISLHIRNKHWGDLDPLA
jgi:hypothetical protein